MNLGISQSRISTPSQEVKQIGHLLVLAGLIYLVGSLCWCLCWCLSCLGLRPISRPCDLYPELVQSKARKRSKALVLQAETHPIKTIMGLYMCPVVGRLLANKMP